MLVCDVTRVVVGAVDANTCTACCRVVVSRVLRILLSYSAVVVAEIIQCNNRYWSIAVLTLARQDVDGRLKVAWSRWRDLSGVIYDTKVPMKLKSKLYKTVVRPAVVYGSECWALRQQEEQRLHTTEMKMLRWSQGKTRKDRIKNETIRGIIVRVTPIKSVLTQKRLSWYGHVMRREETYITRSTLRMTVMGTRPRGRPKMRWLDRMKSDMRIYGINPEMDLATASWTWQHIGAQIIFCQAGSRKDGSEFAVNL